MGGFDNQDLGRCSTMEELQDSPDFGGFRGRRSSLKHHFETKAMPQDSWHNRGFR